MGREMVGVMPRASKNMLAIALANMGHAPTYIDDDEGMRYMTIAFETKTGSLNDWAWYVRIPGEELGPFATRFEAACKALQVGWMPRSFFEERKGVAG